MIPFFSLTLEKKANLIIETDHTVDSVTEKCRQLLLAPFLTSEPTNNCCHSDLSKVPPPLHLNWPLRLVLAVEGRVRRDVL